MPRTVPITTTPSSTPITPAPCCLPGQRPRRQHGPDLGAKPFDAETCKLGVTNDDAELRVQILKAYLHTHIYEKLLKKAQKKQKSGLGSCLLSVVHTQLDTGRACVPSTSEGIPRAERIFCGDPRWVDLDPIKSRITFSSIVCSTANTLFSLPS